MITIRPYTPHYQSQVIALICAIQQDEFAIPTSLADQPDLLTIPAVYQGDRGNFWVAELQGTVIGTIALLDIGHNWGVLRRLFVHKDYRGSQSGCAQQLLNTLFGWAAQQGLMQVYLGTTDRFKAAHRFYEKHGFVEISQAQLPKEFPAMALDTKFYRYDLGKRWQD